MRIIWRGKWKKGEIIVEVETLQELENVLQELSTKSALEVSMKWHDENIPNLPFVKGCTEAVRALIRTEWGMNPRSMNDIRKALESNGLYFSKGTLSGTLTMLVKRGELRRVKEDGRWKYTQVGDGKCLMKKMK